MKAARMLPLDEVKARLSGPIATVRTPYDRRGDIDWEGLRACVEFDLAAGSPAIVVTAGDSHLVAMSDQEIGQVARAVVECVNGRALTVVADRWYDTKQAVAFAGYAREIGADMVMVLPPDWGASSTPESLADHYAEVAKTMPVVLVTAVFGPRGIDFGLNTLKAVLARTDNVLSVKDDVCGAFSAKMCSLVHDRMHVWAGGQKRNHMLMLPYGCDGYLSTFLTFKPEVAHRYWAAIQGGDLSAAAAIVRDVDMPFFDLICGMTGGFDAGIHGVMEIFGLCGRWRPRPYHSLTDVEMEDLRAFFTTGPGAGALCG